MQIAAIPRIYRGVQFKSTLEARWAVFFDAVGVRWSYEPLTLTFDTNLGEMQYTPDFGLYEGKRRAPSTLWEIKPCFPEQDYLIRLIAFAKGIKKNRIARSLYLAWGSFYTNNIPDVSDLSLRTDKDGWGGVTNVTSLVSMFKCGPEPLMTANQYRFDLPDAEN